MSGCSPDHLKKSGDYYFERGVYPEAIRYYEKYLAKAKTPQAESAAAMALARSWARLNQCDKSFEYLERVASGDPMGPQARQAQNAMLGCENYFPLDGGDRWEDVDSATKGRNMWAASETQKQPGSFVVRRKIYAGINSKRLVHETIYIYAQEPGLLWERVAGAPTDGATLLLRFPYEPGSWWRTIRNGKSVRRTIIEKHATASVAAGTFGQCIEVMEELEGGDLSEKPRIYDTYCLGVGRVRQRIGAGERKEPHSELLARSGITKK